MLEEVADPCWPAKVQMWRKQTLGGRCERMARRYDRFAKQVMMDVATLACLCAVATYLRPRPLRVTWSSAVWGLTSIVPVSSSPRKSRSIPA